MFVRAVLIMMMMLLSPFFRKRRNSQAGSHEMMIPFFGVNEYNNNINQGK
jgi:hypothetical protein